MWRSVAFLAALCLVAGEVCSPGEPGAVCASQGEKEKEYEDIMNNKIDTSSMSEEELEKEQQSGQEKEEKKVYDAIMGNSGEGEASEGPGGKYYYAKSLPYSYYYDGKAASEQEDLKALAEDTASKYYYGKDEDKEGD